VTSSERILVPIDGSANSERAFRFALEQARRSGAALELLNVQPAMHGVVTMFVAKTELDAFRRDEAMKLLGPANAAAAEAGVAHDHHIGVGAPGPTIAAFAAKLGCTQIVMGTRGHGKTLNLILGSVATAVIHDAGMPVTLVK
jgi:nucleotide-binding universal stress UspA family protein